MNSEKKRHAERPAGFEPDVFVFDRSFLPVQRLLKAGVPAEKLEEIAAEDARAADIVE